MRSQAKASSAGSKTRSPKLLVGLFAALALTLVLGVAPANATVPVVTVEADEVGYVDAKAKGTVDPGELETSYRFEYITDAQFDQNETESLPPFNGATEVGAGSFSQAEAEGISGPTAVTPATLEGLTPDTEYHLRLVAENADGTESDATTFETKAVTKPSITPIVVSAVTDTSAHFSAEVDPNGTDPAFAASWSFTCTPACKDAKGHPLKGGTVSGGPKEVSADAAQLDPNTEYTVKLTATNAGGTEEKTTTFETGGKAPSVKAFAAGPIQATQASINGTVNPHSSPTTYWFEWGTQDCSANPCQAIPATKDADAGFGPFNVYVSRLLTGLSPESTYHFRLIAQNATGTTEGPDQTFTTASLASEHTSCANAGFPGAGFLPDCRAWEMVSPPDKHGGNIAPTSDRVHAAADGNGLAFTSMTPFGDAQGTAFEVEYVAQRDAAPETNGWRTHAITPKQPSNNVIGSRVPSTSQGDFSADLSHAVYSSWRPLGEAPNVASVPNLYLREDLTTPGAGSYQLLTDSLTPAPVVPPPLSDVFHFVAAYLVNTSPHLAGTSTNFEHVLFESTLGLTADVPMPDALELLFGSAPTKLYENAAGEVRHVGRVPASGAFCDDVNGPLCQVAPSSGVGAAETYTDHMISSDGSRIFFGAGGGVYLREDGERTYQLNASEKASPDEPQPPGFGDGFWDASSDGSRAFFSTGESLLEQDEDTAPDLYMYEVEKPAGERLTLVSASRLSDGHSNAVIGASADGRYVYFFASGQLIPGEPASLFDLYVWHDGDLSYIGNLGQIGVAMRNSPQTPWGFVATARTSRISPDGRHLLFMTVNDDGFKGRGGFEGYDHAKHEELYLYSADSGKLRCASCNPAGTPASADAYGDAKFSQVAGLVASIQNPSQALSDDGRYVFFSTGEGLVTEDTNGTWDAYVYDSQSEETRLLSSGEDNEGSWFMDATPDGKDAFFATAEPLSRWDTDGSYDIYDARIDGGLPEPKLPPPSCQGDACQPAPKQLNDPTPASSTFKGTGNPPKSRCPKGKRKVKARGGKSRCVKRRAKKGQRRHANNNRRAGR